MKLWIISDLHLEFDLFPFWPTLPDADVCVAAGDIHNPGARAIEWLAETIAPRMPVVFVLGNHEFYGGGTYREVVVDSLLASRRHHRVHLWMTGPSLLMACALSARRSGLTTRLARRMNPDRLGTGRSCGP